MRGETRLRLQKIKYARRDVITTPEDKICAEGCDYNSRRLNIHGGTRLRLQEIKYARRNATTTSEDKIWTEECDYDSRR